MSHYIETLKFIRRYQGYNEPAERVARARRVTKQYRQLISRENVRKLVLDRQT